MVEIAFRGEFELIKEGFISKNSDIIKIKKVDFNEKKDSGLNLLGWISEKRLNTWCDFFNDKNTKITVIERNDNPKHITLYEGQNIIGWIDKKYKDQIIIELEKLKELYLQEDTQLDLFDN